MRRKNHMRLEKKPCSVSPERAWTQFSAARMHTGSAMHAVDGNLGDAEGLALGGLALGGLAHADADADTEDLDIVVGQLVRRLHKKRLHSEMETLKAMHAIQMAEVLHEQKTMHDEQFLQAQGTIKQLRGQVSAQEAMISQKDLTHAATLSNHAAKLSENDAKLSENASTIERLEKENADYRAHFQAALNLFQREPGQDLSGFSCREEYRSATAENNMYG